MTHQPARVQRTRPRKKGERGMPPGAVYVGRSTRWGNPNRIVPSGDGWAVAHDHGGTVGTFLTDEAARRFATDAYRHHLNSNPELIAAARRELAGRDLACWCPLPEPGETDWCHAAVLLEIANQTEGSSSQ